MENRANNAGTPLKWLLAQWTVAWNEIGASLLDAAEQTSWTAQDEAPVSAEADLLWHEQPMDFPAGAVVWIGAPEAAWMRLGSSVLHAAGLSEVEAADARQTYSQMAGQAMARFAELVGACLEREIRCRQDAEQAPADGIELTRVAAEKPELGSVLVAFSAPLVEAVAKRLQGMATEVSSAPQPQQVPSNPVASRQGASGQVMDLLLGIDLPLRISFGRAQLRLKDVLKLTSGSIIELNRSVSEPVEVVVNNCVIARGELVVVDGNYGVRILEIVSRQRRMEALP